MGSLIAKLRKKPDTIEVLEKIDKKIGELQKFRWRTQQLQTQFIGSLILYSIIIYILGALVFFLYYFPHTWMRRFLYSAPLLLFPILVWLTKKFLHWYFVKRIAKNDMKLSDLRGEKRQILEEVMEKETYKKAKEILEKFDPERFKRLEPQGTPQATSTPIMDSNLRQRIVPGRGPNTPLVRPRLPTPQSTPLTSNLRSPRPVMRPPMSVQRNGTPGIVPSGPPLPRPILPRQRGVGEKLVDYLVGDGPQNRYALICRQCQSHNGMALPEEFEYLGFRCCYCFTFNSARKQRPNAPRIDFHPMPSNQSLPPLPSTPQISEDENEEQDKDDNSTSVDDGPDTNVAVEGTDKASSDKPANDDKPTYVSDDDDKMVVDT